MSATLATLPPAPPPTEDPYRLGWRMVECRLDDGSKSVEQVPLTDWDVLHPQEDDFIVQNDAHTQDCIYLLQSIETVMEGRSDVFVLYDHRIDWQEPGVLPHGPDITVLAEIIRPWNPRIGTFPVRDMNAKVLLVVEVTSPTTRENDIDEKIGEYHRAKIPYYVIVDTRENRENGTYEVVVNGYRSTPGGYVVIADDRERGIWIPTVGIGFKGENDHVRCFDEAGLPIPSYAERYEQLRTILRRQPVGVANDQALQEKLRADAAEDRIRELEAREAEAGALQREREAREAEAAALEREREARAAEAAAQSLARQEKLRADAAEDRIRELEDKLKNRQS